MTLLFLKLISKALNILPRPAAMALGSGIGLVWFYAVPIRKRTVIANIKQVFGNRLTDSEARTLARQNYLHYGKSFIEILLSLTWSREQFQKEVVIEGWENFKPYIDYGRGAFILTAHLGNWELLIGSCMANGTKAAVLVRKIKSTVVESIMSWYREEHMGAKVIHESGTAKEIMKAVRSGHFIPFVFDQFMGPPVGLPVKFMGQTAGTMAGLALLTEATDADVIPLYSFRDAEGKLHTVVGPALKYPALSADKEERLYQKTQFYNDQLEVMIRRHPEQWLWLHRRWKPFQGQPKWTRLVAPALSVLLSFFVVTCTSTRTTSTNEKVTNEHAPEGIELPPAPKVVIPKFEKNVEQKASVEKSRQVFLEEPKKSVKKESPKKKREAAQVAPQKKAFELRSMDSLPFEMGERVVLRLRWQVIPAGDAIMEVRPGPAIEGRPTFMLWGNARSNRVVDLIYRLNNTVETYVDREGIIPYLFRLHMDEKDQLKETRVVYDHVDGRAHYFANRKSQKWGDQIEDRVDTLEPGAQDLWSALYYVRLLNYEMGVTESFYIYENGKNYLVELTPTGREMLNTGAGTFQCLKIEVRIKLDNVLAPIGAVHMWLSDDSKKFLVRFDAKIKVGTVYGDLIDLREGL